MQWREMRVKEKIEKKIYTDSLFIAREATPVI